MECLYRGVNEEIHKNGIGLTPKGKNRESHTFYGTARYGSGETYGMSVNNAIILHQRDSQQFPSAFISTTPHYERAKYYALQGGKGKKGYIYKINCSLFGEYSIEAFDVKTITTLPEIPEDDEVLLITKGNNKLPTELIEGTEELVCE